MSIWLDASTSLLAAFYSMKTFNNQIAEKFEKIKEHLGSQVLWHCPRQVNPHSLFHCLILLFLPPTVLLSCYHVSVTIQYDQVTKITVNDGLWILWLNNALVRCK